METKLLKTYRGFSIEKSYNLVNGKQKDIIYTAYINDALFDGAKSLVELKRKIDTYVK